jgi:hypothetical protein
MSMKYVAVVIALALTACADPHLPLGPDFGNAVNANIAAQVVNPTPAPPGIAYTNGQRMENAIIRYETNKVYKPHLPLEGGKVYDQPQQYQQQPQ